MAADRPLVEGSDGETEMVDVPPLAARGSAAGLAERPVDGDEIDE